MTEISAGERRRLTRERHVCGSRLCSEAAPPARFARTADRMLTARTRDEPIRWRCRSC